MATKMSEQDRSQLIYVCFVVAVLALTLLGGYGPDLFFCILAMAVSGWWAADIGEGRHARRIQQELRNEWEAYLEQAGLQQAGGVDPLKIVHIVHLLRQNPASLPPTTETVFWNLLAHMAGRLARMRISSNW